MSEAIVRTSLKGLMENIKRSKYALAPLHEALANSLEAILQKENFASDEAPEINITFEYSGLLEASKSLSRIIVQDNGVGFDDINYTRFETLLDRTKGYNNRGSGRVQFVHRFDRIDVVSYFVGDNHESFKRSFSCSKDRFIYSDKKEPDLGKNKTGSTVTFIAGTNLGNDRAWFDALTITDISRDLKRHFMLRYYLDTQKEKPRAPTINIAFFFNEKEKARTVIRPADMPAPAETGHVNVKYYRLRDTKKPDDIIWEPLSSQTKCNTMLRCCSHGKKLQAVLFGGTM